MVVLYFRAVQLVSDWEPPTMLVIGLGLHTKGSPHHMTSAGSVMPAFRSTSTMVAA